jgi:hypothetical protein
MNLSNLTSKYPDKAGVFELISKFNQVSPEISENVYTLSKLLDKLSLNSSFDSALVINILQKEGIISKLLRVESPSLGGIGNFSSISEIPNVIHDFRTDTEIEVSPDNILVLYQFKSANKE